MKLALRGYAVHEHGLWVAVCLDFCLGARGDTADEAAEKLECQIQKYIYDALVGEDKAYGDHFLHNRGASLSAWFYCYYLRVLSALRLLRPRQIMLDRRLTRWLWGYLAEALGALPYPEIEEVEADRQPSPVKPALVASAR